jgi:hypothetical protein
VVILKAFGTDLRLKRFVSESFNENSKTILAGLHKDILELNNMRRPSAHGEKVDKTYAEKTRVLVLGTPSKPGLLKNIYSLEPIQENK